MTTILKRVLTLVTLVLSFAVATAQVVEPPPEGIKPFYTEGRTRADIGWIHTTFNQALAQGWRDGSGLEPNETRVKELEALVNAQVLVKVKLAYPALVRMGYKASGGASNIRADADGTLHYSGNWDYTGTVLPAGYVVYAKPVRLGLEKFAWPSSQGHFTAAAVTLWVPVASPVCGNPIVSGTVVSQVNIFGIPLPTERQVIHDVQVQTETQTQYVYVERPCTQQCEQFGRFTVGGTGTAHVLTQKTETFLVSFEAGGHVISSIGSTFCPGGPPILPPPPPPPPVGTPPNNDENYPRRPDNSGIGG